MIEIWKAYVEAQEIIANQYAQPLDIRHVRNIDENQAVFEHIEKPYESLTKKIQSTFPGINFEDLNLDEGYFLYSTELQEQLSEEQLKEFIDSSRAKGFDFSPNPVVGGRVKLQYNPYRQVERELDIRIDRRGQCNLTKREVRELDQYINASGKEVSRLSPIGAVYKIEPSLEFKKKECDRAIRYLKDKAGIHATCNEYNYRNLNTRKSVINEEDIEWMQENTCFFPAYFLLVTVKQEVIQAFNINRREQKVYYRNEDSWREAIEEGIVLPTPQNENEFRYLVPRESNDLKSDIQYEAAFRRVLYNRLFGKGNYTIESELHFLFDEDKALQTLRSIYSDKGFNFSLDSKTVAFDFERWEEKEAKMDILTRNRDFLIGDYNADHKYKVALQISAPFDKIEGDLKKDLRLETKRHHGGTVLLFRGEVETEAEEHQLRLRVQNYLDQIDRTKYAYSFEQPIAGKVKYSFWENLEEYYKQLERKFSFLEGESLDTKNGKKLGEIIKANYPKLTVSLEPYAHRLFSEGGTLRCTPNLKGERDRIKRLKDTIDCIFNEPEKLVNKKIGEILIDPQETEINTRLFIDRFKHFGNQVKKGLLSPNRKLNQGQLDAICKALAADDFFLIQGPPGTGKSTVIAEIVWQHILQNKKIWKSYKVLVTSETNLAVDNALEKLRNPYHTLVKPIRFGSEDKIDKEGRYFSNSVFEHWANTEEKDEVYDHNAVFGWMKQVADRAHTSENSEVNTALANWKSLLHSPTVRLKEMFTSSYRSNCNVVGATCSSIGKINSMGFRTRFFREYCELYYPNIKPGLTRKKEIIFDLVIQDESSKASPPELALPLVYTKKAVVIGDHKQLPPMVDSNEFIDTLKTLQYLSSSQSYRDRIDRLINQIRQTPDLFDKSHFEFLFDNLPDYLKSTFGIQYRMHPAINETIQQFYIDTGGLKCGLVHPTDLGVNNPDLSNPASRYHGIVTEGVFSSSTHVVWINVDTPEYKKGTSRVNYGEVEVIGHLLKKIIQTEGYGSFVKHWKEEALEDKEIGIITFYGAQAMELDKLRHKYPKTPLRISPVDRFQGMERNIVIVSTVRSNKIASFPSEQPNYEKHPELGYPEQKSLGFAESPNRLNVALSRAKRLLIVVGNADHFCRKPIYRNVFDAIDSHPNGQVVEHKNLN